MINHVHLIHQMESLRQGWLGGLSSLGFSEQVLHRGNLDDLPTWGGGGMRGGN